MEKIIDGMLTVGLVVVAFANLMLAASMIVDIKMRTDSVAISVIQMILYIIIAALVMVVAITRGRKN